MGPCPSFFMTILLQKIYEKRESFQKHIIFSYLNCLEFQNFDIFGPTRPHIFVSYIDIIPQNVLMPNRFSYVFLHGIILKEG